VTQPLPASGLAGLDRAGEVGRRVEALAGVRVFKEVLEVRTRRRPFGLEIYGETVGELALDDTVIAIGTNDGGSASPVSRSRCSLLG